MIVCPLLSACVIHVCAVCACICLLLIILPAKSRYVLVARDGMHLSREGRGNAVPIYVSEGHPRKHAVMARNRFGTETTLPVSFRYRIGSGPLRHVDWDGTDSVSIRYRAVPVSLLGSCENINMMTVCSCNACVLSVEYPRLQTDRLVHCSSHLEVD